MNQFSNAQVRKDFTIGITEILAKIYKVSDPKLKRNIFDELTKLTDKELIAKKDLVERYLEQSTALTKTYTNKLIREGNNDLEKEERKNISLNF